MIDIDRLTPKELEVLYYVGKGYSNGQIATILKITKKSISMYTSTLYSKTGFKNRIVLGRVARDYEPEISAKIKITRVITTKDLNKATLSEKAGMMKDIIKGTAEYKSDEEV